MFRNTDIHSQLIGEEKISSDESCIKLKKLILGFNGVQVSKKEVIENKRPCTQLELSLAEISRNEQAHIKDELVPIMEAYDLKLGIYRNKISGEETTVIIAGDPDEEGQQAIKAFIDDVNEVLREQLGSTVNGLLKKHIPRDVNAIITDYAFAPKKGK